MVDVLRQLESQAKNNSSACAGFKQCQVNLYRGLTRYLASMVGFWVFEQPRDVDNVDLEFDPLCWTHMPGRPSQTAALLAGHSIIAETVLWLNRWTRPDESSSLAVLSTLRQSGFSRQTETLLQSSLSDKRSWTLPRLAGFI